MKNEDKFELSLSLQGIVNEMNNQEPAPPSIVIQADYRSGLSSFLADFLLMRKEGKVALVLDLEGGIYDILEMRLCTRDDIWLYRGIRSIDSLESALATHGDNCFILIDRIELLSVEQARKIEYILHKQKQPIQIIATQILLPRHGETRGRVIFPRKLDSLLRIDSFLALNGNPVDGRTLYNEQDNSALDVNNWWTSFGL